MNILQKALGMMFPPYKFHLLRKEHNQLFKEIITALPDEFLEIKQQALHDGLFGLDYWKLYPDFKFVTIAYKGTLLQQHKKRGHDFRISGIELFSKRTNKFENIEILVQSNLIVGLKISNSDYNLKEFDFNRMITKNITCKTFIFPPDELDIFYDSLTKEVKSKLRKEQLYSIEVNNRTFYAFYDLEDGNCLAIDKKLKTYSLIHDAQPIAAGLKISFIDLLDHIATDHFDKEQHFAERYKNT